VCHEHDCLVQLVIQCREDLHDLFAGARVEVAGRLVGENQIGIGNDCACDREFVYYDQTTRACDGMLARISVCSDVEVCQAALDALRTEVSACEEPGSPFEVDLGACDGP